MDLMLVVLLHLIVCDACITNTVILTSAGAIGWLILEYIFKKTEQVLLGLLLGALAGLVVITPAAGYVTYLSATIMALIGSIFYIVINYIKVKLKYS